MNYIFLLFFLSLSSTGSGQTSNFPILKPPPAPNPSQKLATNPFDGPSADERAFDNAKEDSITPAAEVSSTTLPEISLRPTDGIMSSSAEGIMTRPPNKLISPRPTDGIPNRNNDGDIQHSNADPIDVPISVGNYQFVYNETLRAAMRIYQITPDEIRRMLELYAKNGSATITKSSSPANGIVETVTFDLEEFITEKPGALRNESTTSVEPRSTSLPESQFPLGELLEKKSNLQEQIKELDARITALDISYILGTIPKSARDENTIAYKEKRKNFISDLVAIQQDINNRTERVTIKFKGSTRASPQPFIIQEVILTRKRTIVDDIDRLARGNRELEARLNAMTQGRPVIDTFGLGPQIPEIPTQDPPFTELPGPQLAVRPSPSSLDALKRELTSVRAREINILNQIRQLRNSHSIRNSGALPRPLRWPKTIRTSVMSQNPGTLRRSSFGTEVY